MTEKQSDNFNWEKEVNNKIKQGHTEQAKNQLFQILNSNKNNPKALCYLGQVLYIELDKAELINSTAWDELHTYLKLLEDLNNQGKINDAISLSHFAIPYFNSHNQLLYANAALLEVSGNSDQAISAYARLLESNPEHDPGWENYISLLLIQGKPLLAIPLLEAKLKHTDDKSIQETLLRCYFACKKYEKVESLALKMLDHDAENTFPLAMLCMSHYFQENMGSSQDYLRQFIQIGNFKEAELALQLLNTASKLCDFESLLQLPEPLKKLSVINKRDMIANSICQLSIRSLTDTPDGLSHYLEQQARWGELTKREALKSPFAVAKNITYPPHVPKNTIKFGFLSVLSIPKLAEILAPFFKSLIDLGNPVILFNVSVNDDEQQQVANAFKGNLSQFIPIFSLNDQDTAKIIAQHDLDVLIDLNGMQQPKSRVGAFAWRPAPLQLIWAGIPTPCMFTEVDGQILDPFLVHDSQLGPQPVILPRVWTTINQLPDLDLKRQSSNLVTFSVMVSADKIRPKQIQLWSEILNKTNDSEILFSRPDYSNKVIQNNLHKEFSKHNVSPWQIRFNNDISSNHLAIHNQVDINLDSYPVNSGLTIIEAAWMGVPTVSLCGEALHQRIGNSVLNNIDMKQGITFSAQDYVDKAVNLSQNITAIKRDEIRQKVRNSSFLNWEQFCTDFQAAIKNMINSP